MPPTLILTDSKYGVFTLSDISGNYTQFRGCKSVSFGGTQVPNCSAYSVTVWHTFTTPPTQPGGFSLSTSFWLSGFSPFCPVPASTCGCSLAGHQCNGENPTNFPWSFVSNQCTPYQVVFSHLSGTIGDTAPRIGYTSGQTFTATVTAQ
jgi:hypothetical protein